MKISPDITEIYILLLKGHTVTEIRTQYGISVADWELISSKSDFNDIIKSDDGISNKVKIKEIEDNLFALLSLPKKDHAVNRRIDALTTRYSSFLCF